MRRRGTISFEVETGDGWSFTGRHDDKTGPQLSRRPRPLSGVEAVAGVAAGLIRHDQRPILLGLITSPERRRRRARRRRTDRPAAPDSWPAGARVIVRRERPHPGAQLSPFEERDGWRYTAIVTNAPVEALQWLEARHRAHARVEDRIRCAKESGLRRLPSPEFAINAAWCAPQQPN